ncbi:sulfite reductase (NADPH) alpha subunit [Luteibacter rhizovicinus]|uniref:Sulfite reductase [NADPH] flavoprotein alpha-component n=1 Tax=Luteibacter rhizovicinus TaxID=242606 RepID=A0A4R3YYP9_9GAMM|nr:assimilatory sulfite reductase (NADPH) flavoprotein subunit [Luteibacter rhizovicinus]TCV97682.1 sulfite reductase (NADPH) alpha subunit [Luteibacter rhizovicinus]
MNAVVSTDLEALPLDAATRAQLARVAEGLKPAELYWAAAWLAARAAPPIHDAPARSGSDTLTVIYGSQTGNARRAAEALVRSAESGGLRARLVRADAYPVRELAKERFLAIVASTQGDGDPSDDAKAFIEFLESRRAPRLPDLRYAVLALGDSSYPRYCEIGRRLDTRLAELGAERFVLLGEADVDVETVSAPWTAEAIDGVRPLLTSTNVLNFAPARETAVSPRYSREQPFEAAVLANQRIVSRDCERDVRHIEISLEGSGLRYAPGDSLGVWPRNPPALVADLLAAADLAADVSIAVAGRSRTLAEWLTDAKEITRLSRPFVAALAERSGRDELRAVLDPVQAPALRALLDSHQPLDLLRRYPATWTADALLAALRPLLPRLYSIASSATAVGEEAHLTVAVVDYEAHGHRHVGAATNHLALAGDEASLRVFIETNDRFRLPADPATDIVMIGPGTGVAPFRAFIQERQATGARGRSWLLFGNRHARRDFLYQAEWQAALKMGALTRFDLAFSRDRGGKVYVQQRLRENGAELYAWLAGGAHLYVCGDAQAMAPDVHAALIDIVVEHGGRDRAEAAAWLDELLQQGRYARDVY